MRLAVDVFLSEDATGELFSLQVFYGLAGDSPDHPITIEAVTTYGRPDEPITPVIKENKVYGLKHLAVYYLEVDMLKEGFGPHDHVIWQLHAERISVLDMIDQCS